MIRMPDVESLTAVYDEPVGYAVIEFRERYAGKVAGLVGNGENFASVDPEFVPVTEEQASLIAAEDMARDMSYFRERILSATINLHSTYYDADKCMSVVNDILARLTALRWFLSESVPGDDVQKARLDTRVECFQEHILLETRRALRQYDLVEQFGENGYSAVRS